ncbi:hypothetical protein ACO2Q8_24370 [Larkinella sp. VNQ87]|uniref:hypothetical protein n=1 Tax=Larkinella sp. VNQ87 TaxID=3400921 RepID=UPI003C0A6F17
MALPNSPVATATDRTADAEYPENMPTSGYGGSASMPTGPDEDDEEYDEEELTITDDDDEDPVDEEDEDEV